MNMFTKIVSIDVSITACASQILRVKRIHDARETTKEVKEVNNFQKFVKKTHLILKAAFY